MKKILLTSFATTLSLRVGRLLTDKFNVFNGSSETFPAVFKDKVTVLPSVNRPSFAHEMLAIALDNNVDYILPLSQKEIIVLAESKILFEEYGITIVCPDKSDLDDIMFLSNPEKSMELSLVVNSFDILHDKSVDIPFDGLGVISDSGEDFFLLAQK